jgi:hypothetical protein
VLAIFVVQKTLEIRRVRLADSYAYDALACSSSYTERTGHLHQGRFKTFPIEQDEHLLRVLRYVERNPLRAGLCMRAEDWRFASAWRNCHGTAKDRTLCDHLVFRAVDEGGRDNVTVVSMEW